MLIIVYKVFGFRKRKTETILTDCHGYYYYLQLNSVLYLIYKVLRVSETRKKNLYLPITGKYRNNLTLCMNKNSKHI